MNDYVNVFILPALALGCLLALASCQLCEKRVCSISTAVVIGDENYVYSSESTLIVGDKRFSRRRQAIYDEQGNLSQFILHKPEGPLVYQRAEILADIALLDTVQFPLHQNWKMRDGRIETSTSASIEVIALDDTTMAQFQRGTKATANHAVLFTVK